MPDSTDCERLRKSIKEKDLKLSQLEKQIKEYEIEIKELNDQNVKEKEETKKKLEELDKEIEKLKEEKIQLEKEIGKLREKLARMENRVEANEKRHREEIEGLKNTIEENENHHQTKMKELKDGYKDDMRKLKQEMEEYRENSEWNDEENQKLKEENKKLRVNPKGNEKVIQNEPKLYLGQICFELQDNFYRYVMPERCCAQGYWYKIKELEKDIEHESLFKGEERKKAQRKFEELKKRIDWEELHENVLLTIKRLKGQRNEKAHPRVNEKEVRDAANTLNEQGQLRGRIEFDRVQQVIEIWLTSKSLLGGQHKPKSN